MKTTTQLREAIENRPPIPPITNQAEFYAAENTYQHLRYTARYYRELIKEIPAPEYIAPARQAYREADRRYYARQEAKADKKADVILEMMNEFENREAE